MSVTRGTLHFFTSRLSDVFDRCKITDENGIYVLMAPAGTFIHDTKILVINRTFFRLFLKTIYKSEAHRNSTQI